MKRLLFALFTALTLGLFSGYYWEAPPAVAAEITVTSPDGSLAVTGPDNIIWDVQATTPGGSTWNIQVRPTGDDSSVGSATLMRPEDGTGDNPQMP